MMAATLPAVLIGQNGSSSISTERALNQIRDLLNRLLDATGEGDWSTEDRILASIDDVDVMLQAIER